MHTERFSLPVERYKDSKGNPACAANFKTGQVCMFYMTSNFGTKEQCFFLPDGRLFRRTTKQGKGMGTLIPCTKCPIWPELSVEG